MIKEIQIYKDTFNLTIKLYKSLETMPRSDKHILGVKMLDCSTELLKEISLANGSWDQKIRLKYLDSFFNTFETLKIQLRICTELNLLKLSAIADMQILITSISKQLNGWRNSTKSRIRF